MKKLIIISLLLSFSLNVLSQNNNLYSFQVKDINGEIFDLKTLKGKKVIIVNTASKCMYAPQLKTLQKLYKKYKKDGVEIIAFPCNDFYKREPGTNIEISEVYKKKYKITFPVMSKTHVKGDNIHPVYRFLTQKDRNGFDDTQVSWNFQKYLINRNGKIEKIIKPKTKPMSKEIINWIENNN
ncbi:glutathione peroxidase [Bacteroidota bacterium]